MIWTSVWASSTQPPLFPPWHVKWALGDKAYALAAWGFSLSPSFPTAYGAAGPLLCHKSKYTCIYCI